MHQLDSRIGELKLRDWLAVATIIVEKREELRRAESPEHEANGIAWDSRVSEPERVTPEIITLVRRLIETGRIDAIRAFNTGPYGKAENDRSTRARNQTAEQR